MFRTSLYLVLFLPNRPSAPCGFYPAIARSLPPSAHLMSLERGRPRSGLRQSAIAVIALDPLIDVKAVRAESVSA
jgi:hypothetical protein